MEIVNCVQGTEEWFRARMGIPTASEFKTVMVTKGRGEGGESKTRRTYLCKLADEIVYGELTPEAVYTNANMERGHEMEAEARDLYAFVRNTEVEQVGFIRNGQVGCSPDGLIGKKGLLQVKTAFPHILVGYMLRDEFPQEHKAQCQGELWVTEREWIDIAIYWPKRPLFIKRAYRDDFYIDEIAKAVKQFNAELAEMADRIRSYGKPSNLREKLAASAVWCDLYVVRHHYHRRGACLRDGSA